MADHATPSAAGIAATRVRTGRTLDPIQRQAALENALSAALFFARKVGDDPAHDAAHLWAATARCNRALTLLKQASEGVRHG